MRTPGGILPYVMLVVAAVAYGGLFSLNKIAAEAGFPALAYTFWQCLLAGAILLGIAAVGGRPPGLGARALLAYLVIGGLGIGLPIALLSYVAPKLPAGILTLVLALSPPFTYLFGVLARLERFHILGVLGILFGFAGILLIAGPTAVLPTAEMAGWFLLCLLAPVCFAVANVSAALLRPPATSSVAMGSGVLIGAAAVLVPIIVATGQYYGFPHFPTPGDWAMLGATAVECIVIVLFLAIVESSGPVFFAQFNYLAVLAGIGWSRLIFGERLDVVVWAAFALMVTGVVLTSIRPQARRLAQPAVN